MPIKFERIAAGDTLWQKVRQGMGNTTLTREAVFEVHVVAVDERGADVVWNGCNRARWSRSTMEKLYRSRPKTMRDPFSRRSPTAKGGPDHA